MNFVYIFDFSCKKCYNMLIIAKSEGLCEKICNYKQDANVYSEICSQTISVRHNDCALYQGQANFLFIYRYSDNRGYEFYVLYVGSFYVPYDFPPVSDKISFNGSR